MAWYGQPFGSAEGRLQRTSVSIVRAFGRTPVQNSFIATCLAALGEEIGWRGFLAPELYRLTTFTKTTWIIWAVWHYPAIIFSDYHSQAPRLFDLFTLTVTVLGLSASTIWLRLQSGSIWPAVLWHDTHNLFIQGVFLQMSTETDLSKFIIDDFGIGVMVVTLFLGIVFWQKRFELPQALPVQEQKAGSHRFLRN